MVADFRIFFVVVGILFLLSLLCWSPRVGAFFVVFVVLVWFALRGRVDPNISNFSCFFVVAFFSVWLLVFKCFCFWGHLVCLVCCAGFPRVGAFLVVLLFSFGLL